MSAGFTPGPLPIVVRLNRRETSPSKHGGYSLINPDGPEAADTIEQLYEALVEARAALWAIEDSAVESGFDKLGDIIAERLAKANAAIDAARGEQ